MRRLVLGTLAYAAPTFLIGFVWHLILFADYYDRLEVYRDDIVIPFGIVSMLTQGVIYSWVFERFPVGTAVSRIGMFALFGALLSWSYTTLAVGAKHVMTSVPDFLLIETGFTLAQWALAAPLMALVLQRPR